MKQNEDSNGFRGYGGVLCRKIFENLHSAMAILVLLEQVLRQIVFEFFALNFEVFTKYRYDANFSHVFDFCVPVESVGIIVVKEVPNYGKIVFIKSIVEKGPPPLDPPLTHLVTAGTEIAAPHKQQVAVAAEQLRFH